MVLELARSALRRALESRGWRGPLGSPMDGFFARCRTLKSGMAHSYTNFLDVGANVGKTSESALATFKDAKVLAFEPHPQTFSELQARLANNPRFSAYNVALGDATRSVVLFEYPWSLINSLVSDAQYAVRYSLIAKSIEVQCVTLDDFCDQHSIHEVDVLKIDTEGYDLKSCVEHRRYFLAAMSVLFTLNSMICFRNRDHRRRSSPNRRICSSFRLSFRCDLH